MKITRISLEGFRGARRPLEMPCGSGFTVICGPNGSGKSTICDSVEFAIRNTLSPHPGTERGEYLSNYFWWKGEGESKNQSVTIELEDPKGEQITLGRTPSDGPSEELLQSLVDQAIAPDNWPEQLCLTTIIRDEAITGLSTDRPERERYEFALRAIGLATSVNLGETISAVVSRLEQFKDRANAEYERERERVETLTAQLSEASSSTARATQESIDRLRSVYKEQAPSGMTDLTRLGTTIAREQLLLQRRVANLQTLIEAKKRLDEQTSQLATAEHESQLRQLEAIVGRLKLEKEDISLRYAEVDNRLQQERQRNPFLASLALMREHGQGIGLREGRCPLCGSHLSEDEFARHLRELEREIAGHNDQLQALVKAETEARSSLDGISRELEAKQRDYDERMALKAKYSREADDLSVKARALKVELDPASISEAAKAAEAQINSYSDDLAIVQAFANVHRVTELSELLKVARDAAERKDRELTRTSQLHQTGLNMQAALNRVSTEIVRDRLAALKPLFYELYARLRPHPDWPEIDLLLRGDVRPFLSFIVGESLNPRFFFSSGQRRALGLAFLLAVHIARPWCKLETLVLDDPVQHSDDYRALHLVETLAALRMTGRQIICTVEDPALADLLCRRLRPTPQAGGLRIDLGYAPGEGIHIEKVVRIEPFPQRVLAAS